MDVILKKLPPSWAVKSAIRGQTWGQNRLKSAILGQGSAYFWALKSAILGQEMAWASRGLLWQCAQRRQHTQKTQDWLGHIFFELLSELTSSGTSILWVIYSDYPLASLDNLFSLRWPVDTCAWTSKVHLRRFPKPRVTDKPGGSIAFTRRDTIPAALHACRGIAPGASSSWEANRA